MKNKQTIEQIVTSLPAKWQREYLWVPDVDGFSWLPEDKFWASDEGWNPKDKIYLGIPELSKLENTSDGSLKSESNFRWIKKNISKTNWLEFEDALYIPIHRIQGKLKEVLLSNKLVLDGVICHQTFLDVVEDGKKASWKLDDIEKDFRKKLETRLESYDSTVDFLSQIPDLRQFFDVVISEYGLEWDINGDNVYIDPEDVVSNIEDEFLDKYFSGLRRSWLKAANQQELFSL